MKKILMGLIITLCLSLVVPPCITIVEAAPSFPGNLPLTLVTNSASTTQQLVTKAKLSWPWYITRAAGLVAAVLLVLLILSGIGQITGLTYRLMEPLAAWRLHRSLGIAFGVSVLVHVVVLLFDTYAPFTVLQVLLPFASHYAPVTIAGIHAGSLYVALGICSLYASAAIILSSLFLMDKKPMVWRLLHYISYMLVAMIFIHGLYLGTDLRNGILRILWLAGGIIIGIGLLSRLRRARTINRHRDTP